MSKFAKLPEEVLYKMEDGTVAGQSLSNWITSIVKSKKVKALKDEDGNEVQSATEITKALFKSALNDDGSFELPDEMQSYSDLYDFLKEMADAHRDAVAATKEMKETEKAQKAAEREAAKREKEAEDKAFQESQEAFDARILALADKHTKKSAEQYEKIVSSIALPKAVSFANNGMGLVFAEGATKDDLAQATAAVLTGMEGVNNAQAALQFSLGDTVNASIKAKIFRNKNDANEAMRVLIQEKLKKTYSTGAINFYALMAERTPVDKRRVGVAPSIYLAASKIVAPRIKEGSEKDQADLSKKFDDLREEVIDEIANGNITSIKEVQERINQFKGKAGLLKGDTVSVQELLRRFWLASWIKENIRHENDEYTFAAAKDSPAVIKVPVGQVTDLITSTGAELQNLFLTSKGYDVAALISGTIKRGKGDKTEDVPYRLINPFNQDVESLVEEAKKQEEQAKAEAKAAKEKKSKE